MFQPRLVLSNSCAYSGQIILAILMKHSQTYCLGEGSQLVVIKMANINSLSMLIHLIYQGYRRLLVDILLIHLIYQFFIVLYVFFFVVCLKMMSWQTPTTFIIWHTLKMRHTLLLWMFEQKYSSSLVIIISWSYSTHCFYLKIAY